MHVEDNTNRWNSVKGDNDRLRKVKIDGDC